MYYHVFLTKFNLYFKPPLKDICDRKVIEIEFELYLKKAEKNKESLKEDQGRCSVRLLHVNFLPPEGFGFPKILNICSILQTKSICL